MNMERDLISVIVPVYNVAPYLRECLDSVIRQTYDALQILLVDDGSRDGSSAICDEYAAKDERITVVHQKNQGVSAARNAALDLANGKYVVFVDADDILPENAYESMLRERNNAELLACRSAKIDSAGKKISESQSGATQHISNREMLWYLFWEDTYGYQGYIWDKLFVNSIIQKNQLHFDRMIKLNEDRLFLVDYLCHCNRVGFSDTICYYYRQREESAIGETKRGVTPGEMTVTKSFEKMKILVKTDYPEVYYLICRRAFECGMTLYRRSKPQDRENRRYLKQVMWSNARLCMGTPGMSITGKIKIIGHCVLKR